MKWFSVSFISAIVCNKNNQEDFPVYEEIILIGANSEIDLQEKIKAHGELIDKAGQNGITYNSEIARKIFLGVRKIRAIYNFGGDSLNNSPPDNGCELTHSFYIASSMEEAQKLANGESVTVRYVDDAD